MSYAFFDRIWICGFIHERSNGMSRRIFKLKTIAIVTVIALFVCSIGVSAAQPVSIDDFLLNAGFPQNLIDNMSEIQKEVIYDNSKNKNIRFAGYETQDFVLNDDDTLSPVQPHGGLIPAADLTISIFGTHTTTVSGTVLYSTVYPAFEWKKWVSVKNDSFSMAMYSGWEARPGEENLRLHLINQNGSSAQYVDLDPANSHAAGYSYKIPSDIGTVKAIYEGYAYYNIDKTTASASPRISLHYAHDASSSNVSYNVSIGFFSISISGNRDNLYEMSGNFNISGLA